MDLIKNIKFISIGTELFLISYISITPKLPLFENTFLTAKPRHHCHGLALLLDAERWNLENDSANNCWLPKRAASTGKGSFDWDLLARMLGPGAGGSRTAAGFPLFSTSPCRRTAIGCKQRQWCWFYELMMADDDALCCDCWRCNEEPRTVITIKRGQRDVKFDWVSISSEDLIERPPQSVSWCEVNICWL